MSKNEQLIDTAIAALAAGRKETARRILTKVVTTDPCNQQAWLCLAASVPPNLAIPALQKVLVLNPQNEVALQNIYQLRAQPDKELDLADVLVGHNQAGDDLLATFGEESPTIYEPSWWKEQVRFASSRNTLLLDEDSTLQRLIERLVNGATSTATSTVIEPEATLATVPPETKRPLIGDPEPISPIIKVTGTILTETKAQTFEPPTFVQPLLNTTIIKVVSTTFPETTTTEINAPAQPELALQIVQPLITAQPEIAPIEIKTPTTPEIEPPVEISPQLEPALQSNTTFTPSEQEATPAAPATEVETLSATLPEMATAEIETPNATQPEAATQAAEPIVTRDSKSHAKTPPDPVLQSRPTRYYPKTTLLMEARNEPYIKPISLEGISAVGMADFVSGNPTALKYMEFRRNIPARVKLKERPVRRNTGPLRNPMRLTNFGIILITAMLVILIGYLLLMLIGI